MMLGKRSATDALLSTIDTRPYKRTSSDEGDNDSVMTEADSNSGGMASWIWQLGSNIIKSFVGEIRPLPLEADSGGLTP